MAWKYSCPHCEKVINPDETVILVGVHANQQYLVGFHPTPGNYTIYTPSEVELVRGDAWEFFCPLCRSDLKAEGYDNLCELVIWQGKERRRCLFSRVVGEHATYIIEEKKRVAETHGEHADQYDTSSHRAVSDGSDS